MEEQIENIAHAQEEEQQAIQQQALAGQVPEAVIGRALTSGGNGQYSIEHIVAFFQKDPRGIHPGLAATVFMEQEFGEGGKGVTIAGQDYALWFSKEGFRIAPGRSAFGPGSTLVPWENAAAMVANLLRDGKYATQDRIDAALDNEIRELAANLWYLRQNFSDVAKGRNLLPTISQHYFGKGFPDDTKEIAELLKVPVHRQQIMQELSAFADANGRSPGLLRFKQRPDPRELLAQVAGLSAHREQFQAIEDFAPTAGKFITEDELDRLLAGGPNIAESKLEIYSYFVQGHNAKECADFLKKSYGDGGHSHTGYDEWHDSKGIRLSRADGLSGGTYDTVTLNWNQVQKRVRGLIDSGRYLNGQEKAYLPAYEKLTLARKVYFFYLDDPNRTSPLGEMDAALKRIQSVLDNTEKSKVLFSDMAKRFAAVPLDSPKNRQMELALKDMTAFRQGAYSLFTPLPEDVLRSERQAKQAEKEATRTASAPKRTSPQPPPTDMPEGELTAAARALAQKMQTDLGEDEDGQRYIIAGDEIEPYMVVMNLHDGSSGIKVAMTPIRVACQNTLNLALGSAKRTWTTKHTENVMSRVHEARETLLLAEKYMSELGRGIDELSKVRLTDKKVLEFMNDFFPTTTDLPDVQRKNNQRLLDNLKARYWEAPDLSNVGKNGYRFVNAVSDFATHADPIRKTKNYNENLFLRTVEGNPIIDKAYKMVLTAG